MYDVVERVLADRRHRSRWGFAVGLGAAFLLHSLALAAALLAPGRESKAPLEYVAVQVVPLQALGRPAAPEPKSRAAPEPREPAPRAPDTRPPNPEPSSSPSRTPVAAAPEPAPPAAAGRRGSPQGSSSGLADFGATRLQAVDPDFTYDYYLDRMLALIHAGWVRPPTEGEVQAVLSFTVDRKGEITDLQVAQTSGFTAFDLAALRAVDNASPLPPLPASYRRDSLRVTLIVH